MSREGGILPTFMVNDPHVAAVVVQELANFLKKFTNHKSLNEFVRRNAGEN